MKKTTLILIALSMAFCLCACTITIRKGDKANDTGIINECPEEATDEFLAQIADEYAPNIDISGCDTFTQIVDKKLTEGMGYANDRIGNEDVLLVCTQTYDNLDGNMASIDAAVFMYRDGAPFEAGRVCSGGTAYPLAIKDGILYAGSNHWVCKYTIKDDKLVIIEKAAVVYDENGEGTYYCETAEDGQTGPDGAAKPQEKFDAMFDELFGADIVNFSVVAK